MKRLNHLLQGLALAPELDVLGLQTNSKRVTPGDVFLAVNGVSSHGLAYLDLALANGAVAVLWEPAPGIAQPLDCPVPVIAVPQLSRHVGDIAARFNSHTARQLFTVGITGTDGKTSTAYLIAQAFDALAQPCAYLGTIGYGRIGALHAASHTTPDPIRLHEMLADYALQGLSACAMEVSSHALDQARVGGLGFNASVLTNLSRDHLDYHGTVAAYAAAKKKLFTDYTLPPSQGAVILNGDDATGAAWAAEFAAQPAKAEGVIVYGVDSPVPSAGRYVIGRNLRLSPQGLALDVDSSWGLAPLSCRLLGRFNAYNILAALAVLLSRGLPLAQAIQALAGVQTVPGRIEGFAGPLAAPLVVVDYAHTPEALQQILKAVRAHTPGKLICVFGCGGDRDTGKRPLMGAAAAEYADVAIVTDDNPRSEDPAAIVQQILAGMAGNGSVIHDRADAIRAAIALAGPQDVVVVAGKGHETTQTYGHEVRPFSDRHLVAQLVGAPSPKGTAA